MLDWLTKLLDLAIPAPALLVAESRVMRLHELRGTAGRGADGGALVWKWVIKGDGASAETCAYSPGYTNTLPGSR